VLDVLRMRQILEFGVLVMIPAVSLAWPARFQAKAGT
jgi:hypothetical protein